MGRKRNLGERCDWEPLQYSIAQLAAPELLAELLLVLLS
jgi:hypothetical protein